MSNKSLGMGHHYDLDIDVINVFVESGSIGNYALGTFNDGKFTVSYVGRSDSNLNSRLKDHAKIGEFPHFKFSYAESHREAFEKECRNYHDFGECDTLTNEIHPDRPKGKSWACPCCDNFD